MHLNVMTESCYSLHFNTWLRLSKNAGLEPAHTFQRVIALSTSDLLGAGSMNALQLDFRDVDDKRADHKNSHASNAIKAIHANSERSRASTPKRYHTQHLSTFPAKLAYPYEL